MDCRSKLGTMNVAQLGLPPIEQLKSKQSPPHTDLRPMASAEILLLVFVSTYGLSSRK